VVPEGWAAVKKRPAIPPSPLALKLGKEFAAEFLGKHCVQPDDLATFVDFAERAIKAAREQLELGLSA
jgi:hypothetical protein